MKTSNIIIVSLISGLLLIILTAALDVRLNGVHRSIAKMPFSVEKSTTFQSINHIVINDISVTIEQKDRNKVSVNYTVPEGSEEGAEVEEYRQKGNTIQPPELKISGDTLFIDKDIMRGQEKNKHVTVTIAEYLQSVTSNQAHLTIRGGLAKTIDVAGENLFISGSKIEGQFSQINLNANNASVNIITPLDTLSLQLENSNAHIRNPVDLLQGEIRENSKLHTREARYHMNVVKDPKSKLNVY